MTVEAAELLDHFHWLAEEQSRNVAAETRANVADELASMIYLVRATDKLEVVLVAATREELARNAEKYPVEKAHGSARKYTDL